MLVRTILGCALLLFSLVAVASCSSDRDDSQQAADQEESSGGAPGGKADSVPDEDDLTKLKPEYEEAAPVAEASAIAIRQRDTQADLLIVGDRDFTIAVASADTQGEFVSYDVAGLLPNHGEESQWEALSVDDQGRVFVLEEDPGAVYVFSPDLDSLEHTIVLDVPGGSGWRDDLADDWDDEPNSRGEGMVLTSNGHLLVLKEKEPSLVIEFGSEFDEPVGFYRWQQGDVAPWFVLPEGDVSHFIPLAIWEFRGKVRDLLSDMSELTVGPDGYLYVVSGEERIVARIDDDLDPEDDGKLSVDLAWKLSKAASNPEGLQVLESAFVVVSDQPDPPDLFYYWLED